jgi:hypothetical protein
VHTPGLAYMEDMYVLSEIYYRLINDIMQPPDLSEAIVNASVQMLEHNRHYLRAKLMAEQQATRSHDFRKPSVSKRRRTMI